MFEGSTRLVIFDLDGTIVDAFSDIQAALNHALGAHGLAGYDIETVRGFVGNGIVRLCERATPATHLHLLDSITAATREYYAAHPIDHASIYPGMTDAIAQIRSGGIRTAILSNKPDNLVQRIADQLRLRPHFDAIAGERFGTAMKPDPAGVQELMRETNASRVIVVGDGIPDGEVARNAHAGFVGVTWGVARREELRPFGEVVDHAHEIPGAIHRAWETNPAGPSA